MASGPLSAEFPRWESELKTDPDRVYLLDGLRYGFRVIQPNSEIDSVCCPNYRSATCHQNRDRVEAQIKEEIHQNRYVRTSQKPTIISALGAIPKQDSSDLRLIHDCSRPHGKSLNDYAKPETFSFESVDSATKLIKPGYFMSKIDIKSAYRHVGLHPSQYQATGLQWQFAGDKQPTYLYDTRLMFGASESVGCFHRITQSIVRMVKRRVSCSVICYLDDFLIISKDHDTCQNTMNIVLKLLQDLGFAINWSKLIRPIQTLTFLGISLDSVSMSMSIPHSKLQQIKDCALDWLAKSKASKKEIQSLIGKLAWAAKCIRAMRPTLRSLIDLQKGLKHQSHRIRIPKVVKMDISYVSQWCVRFNGVVFFKSTKLPQPDTILTCDASLLAGAACCNRDFVYSNWNVDFPNIASEPIYVKECCAILLGFRRWGFSWRYKTVHVYTDNKGAEYALRKGLTRNVTANTILREILWISAWYNITFNVHYVNTKDNYVADSLSRLDDPRFFRVAVSLLASMGRHILHPSYNILQHMSWGSYNSLCN